MKLKNWRGLWTVKRGRGSSSAYSWRCVRVTRKTVHFSGRLTPKTKEVSAGVQTNTSQACFWFCPCCCLHPVLRLCMWVCCFSSTVASPVCFIPLDPFYIVRWSDIWNRSGVNRQSFILLKLVQCVTPITETRCKKKKKEGKKEYCNSLQSRGVQGCSWYQ